MKSSGQKAGFAIVVMIVVIVAAGIGVDWWDAHRGGPLPERAEAVEGETAKRLADENERLKTDNALLNLKIDELHKQLEELRLKPADAPKTAAEPARTEPDNGRVD